MSCHCFISYEIFLFKRGWINLLICCYVHICYCQTCFKRNKSKMTPHLLVFRETFLPRVFNRATVHAVLLWPSRKPKAPSNRWHIGQLITLVLLRYLASYMNGKNSLLFCLCYGTAAFINALKNGKKEKSGPSFHPLPAPGQGNHMFQEISNRAASFWRSKLMQKIKP